MKTFISGKLSGARPVQPSSHLSPVLERLWQRILPGVIALLIALGSLHVGIGESLENLTYNALFHLRGPIPWSSEVVVIEIDESRTTTQGEFLWSRERLVDLLTILAESDPSVVVFDLLMSESTPFDQALAQAMEPFRRVVLSQSWDEQGVRLAPTPRLSEEAWAIGHTEQQHELDGLVRKIPLLRQSAPALSVVAVSAYRGNATLQLPRHLEQPLWINWAGPAANAQHYTFLDVLNRQVPPAVFTNRVVVLGLTTPTLDVLQTPYDRDPPTSGVYLQAAAIGNLLGNNGLKRLSPGWLVLILVLGGPGLSWLTSHWRLEHRLLLWIVACCGWALLGILLFRWWDYWIPISVPMLLLTVTTSVVALKEQLRINALLRQSEERYALAVQGSNGGLWDWNLKTDTIYFSDRWKEMVGVAETEVGDRLQSWYERVHPDDLAVLQAAIADYLEGKQETFENEHRIRHRDESYRWMLCRGVVVRDRTGKPTRMAGSQIDITARKSVEQQLWRSAYYDDLTGLPNRTFFLDQLRRAIAAAERNALYVYAVLLMDVDRFQVVNNSLGNDIGDQLLVAIARRLKGFFSLESVIARRSGDEFIVLLENIEHPSDASRIAEQIQQILTLPFHLEGHEVYITVSIGIAISSGRHKNPEHLLQDADTAMYRAKAKGKARCQVFDPAMHNRMVTRMMLENDLRRAISNEHRLVEETGEASQPELILYYQPIIQLTTSRIMGFESLARWHHPTMGFLPPSRFITMAEETGLIIPLGWWILRQSCRQMQLWKTQYPELAALTVSVNLASRQFSLPNLTHEIQTVLEETGLPSANLKLEITEGTIMDTGQGVTNVLNQLRAIGIQLSIDDFGTGYSSLSYLSQFPINTLKIDRSFVSKMNSLGKDSLEIVRTIVTLAHNLGMDVTAEGVETQEQHSDLLEMACESGQGYYFAKPLDPDGASDLLRKFVQQQRDGLHSNGHLFLADDSPSKQPRLLD